MFFDQMCLLIENTLSKSDLKIFAQAVLKAQDLKEKSWDKDKQSYIVNNYMAANEICHEIEFSEFWINIMSNMNTHAWNESQNWAKSILK